MPGEPGTHLGLLVGSVVVEDDMHGLIGGQLSFDGIQEPDKLLVAVALHVTPDDRAIEHVQRCE